LYIKFVRFPLKQFVDPQRERRIKLYIISFLVVVAIPSVFIFVDVLRESRFNRNARQFVSAMKADLEDSDSYVNFSEVVYEDDGQLLRIGINGSPLSDAQKLIYRNRLRDFDMETCELRWMDGQNLGKLLEEHQTSRERTTLNEALAAQNHEIEQLRTRLQEREKSSAALDELYTELSMFYADVRAVSFGEVLELNNQGVNDTIPTVMIWWNDSIPLAEIREQEARLKRWLPVQLRLEQVRVWNMNEREATR
jgi:hypothetical protein